MDVNRHQIGITPATWTPIFLDSPRAEDYHSMEGCAQHVLGPEGGCSTFQASSTANLHPSGSCYTPASTLFWDAPQPLRYPDMDGCSPSRLIPLGRITSSGQLSGSTAVDGYAPGQYNAYQVPPRTARSISLGPRSFTTGSTRSVDCLLAAEHGGRGRMRGTASTAESRAGCVVLLDDKSTLKEKLGEMIPAEDTLEYAPTGEKDRPVKVDPASKPVFSQWNLAGSLLFLFYLSASLYYFYIRSTQTLDTGYTWYGVLVLGIEIITSTATYGYGVMLIRYTRSRKTGGLPLDPYMAEVLEEELQFHVRVLVPCYKESVELVRETVQAALTAPLPARTRRTLYLCDDGNDPDKLVMLDQFGLDCVYVTGRVRDPKGETNGKSNNLNHCLKMIYAEMDPIPMREIIVVFDADMVPRPNFYTKILEVMVDQECALCLTPQGFHNVNAQADIFNNLNLSFWEYLLPGCDALGYIACTGTNFAIRADALRDCGWFPTYTITEDYALGMELKKKKYKAAYLNEYLAVGEAPDEVRNAFRQRSRWCKGQMQVLFSTACPLFNSGLSFGMRLLYTSVTWSYITNTLAVPTSILVPFIALVFGYYPLVINRSFALASTLYFIATQAVTMFCTDIRHVKPLWFVSVACHLLWFTFFKAMLNVLIHKTGLKSLVFKSTKKQGLQQAQGRSCWHFMMDMEGTKDVYIIMLSFLISAITIGVGIFQVIHQPYTAQSGFRWYLLLSVCWATYNIIPPLLFFIYIMDKGQVFEDICSILMILGTLAAAGGIVCVWLVPSDYSMGQVLNNALQFYEAQRSGKLPRSYNVPWRGHSALGDAISYANRNHSLVGGWYDDGGHLKSTYPTATTVMMLSWSFLEFRRGYRASNNEGVAIQTIRWGADYLLRAYLNGTTPTGRPWGDAFVVQVGNTSLDSQYWGPPETMTMPRPAMSVNASRPGTDVMAMGAAALAAASVALRRVSSQSSRLYLARAVHLYRLAQQRTGLYSAVVPQLPSAYPSTSMYDDLALAATWIYLAERQFSTPIIAKVYLDQAENFYDLSLYKESHVEENPFQWDYENQMPALQLLLGGITHNPKYLSMAKRFVNVWMRGDHVNVKYTPKSLAKAIPYGTLRHTANAAFYVQVYAANLDPEHLRHHGCWARSQIAYMLGDSGRSFMVGYGSGAPQKVPHRAASCPPPSETNCTWETAYYSNDPNPYTLRGAVVGGPDDQDRWTDDRDLGDPANSVNLLNNAGLTGALAGLVDHGFHMAKCEQGKGMLSIILGKVRRNHGGETSWDEELTPSLDEG